MDSIPVMEPEPKTLSYGSGSNHKFQLHNHNTALLGYLCTGTNEDIYDLVRSVVGALSAYLLFSVEMEHKKKL
jgi:hypothetical protein